MQQAQTGEENTREVVKEEKGENVQTQTENGVSQERKLVKKKKVKQKQMSQPGKRHNGNRRRREK